MTLQKFNVRPAPDLKPGQMAAVVRIVLDDNAPVESVFPENEELIAPYLQSVWESAMTKQFDLASKEALQEMGTPVDSSNLQQFRHLTIYNIAKNIISTTLEKFQYETLINTDELIRVNMKMAMIIEGMRIYRFSFRANGKKIEEQPGVSMAEVLDSLENNSDFYQMIKKKTSDEKEQYVQEYVEGPFTVDTLKI
jgi:hypothetical protein